MTTSPEVAKAESKVAQKTLDTLTVERYFPITNQWTVNHAAQIRQTAKNTVPPFDPANIKALMPKYQSWDNWIMLNEIGQVAKVHGFYVVIALVRPRNAGFSDGERVAYFYSVDGEHYVAGGFLFEETLYKDLREWSGTTVLRDNGKVQTFYTVSYGAEVNGAWQTVQRFATAIQVPSVEDGKLVFTTEYHALLGGACEPDGQLYETPAQASAREVRNPTRNSTFAGSDQTENNCFRDPCFFKDPATGKCYLVFEGNTGPAINYAGVVRTEYIGSASFPKEGFAPTEDMLKANGCIGVIELTNDSYTFGVFLRPWLAANLVTDELERIKVLVHDGHYYLFCAGHGNKNSLNASNPDLINRDYMLGFRADEFGGKLTPLNGSGVVVQQKSLGVAYQGQELNQQFTYSWLIVPREDSHETNEFDCMCYSNYCVVEDGSIQPSMNAGPTLGVRIKGLETCITDLKYVIKPAEDAPLQDELPAVDAHSKDY